MVDIRNVSLESARRQVRLLEAERQWRVSRAACAQREREALTRRPTVGACDHDQRAHDMDRATRRHQEAVAALASLDRDLLAAHTRVAAYTPDAPRRVLGITTGRPARADKGDVST